MDTALLEDITRLTALAITICCTIYNLYCSIRENSCSTYIKKLLKWYVRAYQKGKISDVEFLNGMEHIRELSKITKGSNTENPQNKSED